MSEEDINQSYDIEETETSTEGLSEENNTSNVSEDAQTQKTGRTAQERIQQLVSDKKTLEAELAKYKPADKPSPAQQEPQGDKVLNAKVDILFKAPEHLKAQADEIATYSATHNLPVEDAIAIFDSKSKVSQVDVDAANAAKTEAAQSRTGGTANPAARSETQDVSKMETKDLESKLNQAIAFGEKL
jgi:hypothetical protein